MTKINDRGRDGNESIMMRTSAAHLGQLCMVYMKTWSIEIHRAI